MTTVLEAGCEVRDARWSWRPGGRRGVEGGGGRGEKQASKGAFVGRGRGGEDGGRTGAVNWGWIRIRALRSDSRVEVEGERWSGVERKGEVCEVLIEKVAWGNVRKALDRGGTNG